MRFPYKVQTMNRLYMAGEDVPEAELTVSGATSPEEKPKPDKKRGRPPKAKG